MKRVLRVLKLLMVLVSFGAVSSCINFCSKGEAVEEYDMIGELEYHSPWVYDDGNVSLSVSFEETSKHKEIGIWNRKRDELKVDIHLTYSNKTMKYSFKSDTLATGDDGTIKGHDVRTVQSLISGAYADIHIHYNNEKDITFEFQNAILIRDLVTKVLLPKPVPFVLPLYNLKPSK